MNTHNEARIERVKKTVGIIGGMGPLATADLFAKIVRFTAAGNDREHIHTIIDSNTAIPDRTAAILGLGPSPVPELVKSAQLLENAGADLLVMPCNTAHFYYDDIRRATRLPLLHMLRLTAEEIKLRALKKVALLATDGTVKTGIYARLFEERGIPYVLPDEAGQSAVMDAIYAGVKAGRRDYDTSALRRALDESMERGAEAFVLGCTELPVAFAQYRLDYPVVDPTETLAKAAIREAGYLLSQ
ncbi:MAG TPA: amino acid racemase [Clostridia bacterium]|nr:amino acid racemase [Clostridia bacterium]